MENIEALEELVATLEPVDFADLPPEVQREADAWIERTIMTRDEYIAAFFRSN